MELTDKETNLMCETCEIHILGCKHSTSTFLCEGSHCEEAYQLFQDLYPYYFRERKLKRILNEKEDTE